MTTPTQTSNQALGNHTNSDITSWSNPAIDPNLTPLGITEGNSILGTGKTFGLGAARATNEWRTSSSSGTNFTTFGTIDVDKVLWHNNGPTDATGNELGVDLTKDTTHISTNKTALPDPQRQYKRAQLAVPTKSSGSWDGELDIIADKINFATNDGSNTLNTFTIQMDSNVVLSANATDGEVVLYDKLITKGVLLVEDTVTMSSQLSVGGVLQVEGATTLSSTLAVHDAVTMSSQLSVGDVLQVEGATTLSSTLAVHDAVTMSSQLSVGGSIRVECGGVAGACGWQVDSDRRLKKDIVTLDDNDILDRTVNVRSVQYVYKKNPGLLKYGFIAQELLEIFPTLVNSTNPERFSVNYAEMVIAIPVLAREIKKLRAEIAELKSANTE